MIRYQSYYVHILQGKEISQEKHSLKGSSPPAPVLLDLLGRSQCVHTSASLCCWEGAKASCAWVLERSMLHRWAGV